MHSIWWAWASLIISETDSREKSWSHFKQQQFQEFFGNFTFFASWSHVKWDQYNTKAIQKATSSELLTMQYMRKNLETLNITSLVTFYL
jgi:hypothetical protein